VDILFSQQKKCFLCSLCRGYKTGTSSSVELVESQVTVVKSEKLVAKARESSGTQRKGSVHSWKPLSSNNQGRLKNFMCVVVTVIFRVCSSVRLPVIYSYKQYKSSINPVTNPNPTYNHSIT
jgi:hypothetical protein